MLDREKGIFKKTITQKQVFRKNKNTVKTWEVTESKSEIKILKVEELVEQFP